MLDRYRAIVPDWERFLETSRTREPVTLRVRTVRIPTDALAARLSAQGFGVAPLEGQPEFLRLTTAPRAVSRTLEHWLGLVYIQQAVMGLPARALAAQPGERVLELCAAPGGKTSHLADLMLDTGTLVAVEWSERRLATLAGNLYRLAHPATIVLPDDGRRLGEGALSIARSSTHPAPPRESCGGEVARPARPRRGLPGGSSSCRSSCCAAPSD